ncbi:MAG: CpsB/CapC family capsule biosynthesis tyrosine phosphatase [Lentihominibacter sp.]
MMIEAKKMSTGVKWKLMDIHTHILPDIDDGAGDIEEMTKMIAQADEEGISVIIATPHYGISNPAYDPAKAQEALKTARQVLRESYPHIRMFMGNELYYSPGIIEDLKSGRALTIGGTDYVLVEFPTDIAFDQLTAAVRAFCSEGYRPVVAHIERYSCLFRELDRVHELISLGAYTQVNARGFLAGRFDRCGGWCRNLLKDGVVHFVASDCHNSSTRNPVMRSAVEAMLKTAGEEKVKQIVNTHIIKLIRNEFI